ncbi:hypothetical protein EVAR_35560_1 [Eumeta japonica]|uniref:Uncharacterized protein n=1 Tax=Eumeta variegata TaxID=151549 RepID=A0A4C1XK66_EUMVA|nr:hypothetical protein EVAR_35560_1 [Eumeta japonica]
MVFNSVKTKRFSPCLAVYGYVVTASVASVTSSTQFALSYLHVKLFWRDKHLWRGCNPLHGSRSARRETERDEAFRPVRTLFQAKYLPPTLAPQKGSLTLIQDEALATTAPSRGTSGRCAVGRYKTRSVSRQLTPILTNPHVTSTVRERTLP